MAWNLHSYYSALTWSISYNCYFNYSIDTPHVKIGFPIVKCFFKTCIATHKYLLANWCKWKMSYRKKAKNDWNLHRLYEKANWVCRFFTAPLNIISNTFSTITVSKVCVFVCVCSWRVRGSTVDSCWKLIKWPFRNNTFPV